MLTRREKLQKSVRSIRNRLAPAPHPAIPVFVLGEMRSGTNMLTEAFERTPGTEVFNENDEAAFEHFELRELPAIEALVRGSRGSHVVFKSIADNARTSELLETFQGARVVWIYRRWQDVVNSALRKWKDHREYLRVVLEEPERARWRARNLSDEQLALFRRFYSPALDDASARALIWYVRNQNYFVQGLDRRDDVLLVNYEDLVADPLRELRRTFDFIGLAVGPNSFAHMNTESIGRDPERAVQEAVRELCETLMARLHAARAAG
jgi:hypothetical protein